MFSKLMTKIKQAGMLPRISDTERAALEAGTVWVEGEFFSGNPDFARMLAQAYPQLPPREQAFLDGPVAELVAMLDYYRIQQTRMVPDHIWRFLRDKGFFGLLIPEEYGGFGMSALGRSAVMMKAGGLGAVGTLIVIPNTLGAAELLIAYGTQEQKAHYLPRLASGEYVPCFGLTEPTAGSDAASLRGRGEVFKDNAGQINLRLNFAKRYITLAPVANLVSVAVRLADPVNHLGRGTDAGITVVLVKKDAPGLELGDHHLPISPFDNGPITGRDVVVPVENIIGGPAGAGQGWRMLMEQLSGGRALSLPAGGVAACKFAAAATGPYSMVREQFQIPIGLMEGPRAKVARIAAMAYTMEAARVFVCAAVDNGHQPPVASAILKQHTTEMGQRLAIDGMDVFAGAGVMQGPNNILAMAYIGAPVSITVEGANILTRTLIIFGQGAVRCHPYALKTLHALEADDAAAFKQALVGWLGHFLMNGLRSLARGLTRGWTCRSPVAGPTARYYRRLGWAAARFALLTDLVVFLAGAKLKQKGNLSGRFADALSWQLLAFATLRRFEAEGRIEQDLPIVHWSMHYCLLRVQEAFEGIYANFDAPVVGWLLRYPGLLWLRINPLSTGPSDKLDPAVAAAIQQPGPQYQRIVAGLPPPQDENIGMGRLLKAWRLLSETQEARGKLAKAQRRGEITAVDPESAVAQAVAQGVLSAEEARRVRAAEAARDAAIQVDVFTPEQYNRPYALESAVREPSEAAHA